MTTPGVPTTLPHTIISLRPPGPHTTFQNSQSCTNTIDSSGYGQGCVSSPTCVSPLVLNTDTTTDLYGVPLLLCVSSTSASTQPGGPLSSATVTSTSISNPGGSLSSAAAPSSTLSVQPGGPLSSSVTTGITPSGISSASLHHPSRTESLSTVTGSGTTSTGTSTSSAPASTASGNAAAGTYAGGSEGSLMGLVALCWMGVLGWRTLRGQI